MFPLIVKSFLYRLLCLTGIYERLRARYLYTQCQENGSAFVDDCTYNVYILTEFI